MVYSSFSSTTIDYIFPITLEVPTTSTSIFPSPYTTLVPLNIIGEGTSYGVEQFLLPSATILSLIEIQFYKISFLTGSVLPVISLS